MTCLGKLGDDSHGMCELGFATSCWYKPASEEEKLVKHTELSIDLIDTHGLEATA
jgi:hypothetical protein